jgi:putative tryptophan/tyrosine transport system substrate-binding protein
MRRREFNILLGGAATASTVWPSTLSAQQKATPAIGYLYGGVAGYSSPDVAAFRRGLDETGYVEGQNVAIEYRWAEGNYDRLPSLAADLVSRKVDVIAAIGVTSVVRAAKDATSTIPIVFISGGDPVAQGLVASLSRPGGNVTGVSILVADLGPKRLELLSELVPQAKAIALLRNPTSSGSERATRDVQEAARAKGGAAPSLGGQQRKRDRRRLWLPGPTASRRAPRRVGSILLQPACADRGAGGTPYRSHDL